MRPPRYYDQDFFGPTVVVLTGFHCIFLDCHFGDLRFEKKKPSSSVIGSLTVSLTEVIITIARLI